MWLQLVCATLVKYLICRDGVLWVDSIVYLFLAQCRSETIVHAAIMTTRYQMTGVVRCTQTTWIWKLTALLVVEILSSEIVIRLRKYTITLVSDTLFVMDAIKKK